jgi:large subunit ribosomal protein L21
MSYAIVSIGGKQYRVREGQHLLVDRVALDDGATFTPPVLLVGGDGDVAIAPDDVTVTARVVEQQRGPKLVIGKLKKRTGYRRRTGFRASLTKVQIESIGAGATSRPVAKATAPADESVAPDVAAVEVPDGYAELTIAGIKDVSSGWSLDALQAALAYEREHANRKGAIAALESAIAGKEGD